MSTLKTWILFMSTEIAWTAGVANMPGTNCCIGGWETLG